MKHEPALAFLSISLVLGFGCTLLAQDAAPQLIVRTADDQTTYHIGQRIPLELSFTGSDNKRFEINMATYDRIGRIPYERFGVSPSGGWADPLDVYFGGTIGSMGGAFHCDALSTRPLVINLDLNEWVRFDEPGNYSITIESRRVTDVTEKAPNPYQREPVTLRSNAIRLHIVRASETWQREKLAQIVMRINPHSQAYGLQSTSLKEAIADLRFLGTVAAARVMAQHLREDDPALEFQCMLGLVGLREGVRPAGLSAINKLMTATDFPVSVSFLIAMSVLQVTSAAPEAQSQERDKLMKADWELVLQSLPAKQGTARAETAQALSSENPHSHTPDQNAELVRILASSLKDLPFDQQAGELQWNWDLLQAQISLSTLENMAKIQPDDRRFDSSVRYTATDLKGIALKRWYELDPESAHEEILHQIGSPNPSLNADALSFLPAETLPQFEGLWAEQFMATENFDRETVLAGLLVRFGTGSVVGLVIEKENSKIAEGVCTLPDTALAYLLKFDPESARPLAERAFRAGGDGKSGCRFGFQEIARSVTSPVLTELALQALDDPNPQVTNDALIYLMDYGDKSAEQIIWNNYVEWSEKWRGRAELLEAHQAGSFGEYEQMGLGENLARALIANQGWLASPDLIARVLERCVGTQMCTQLKGIADKASPIAEPYEVSAYRFGPNENYEIAQYSAKSLELLEAKIAQFPRGTRFSLAAAYPRNLDQTKLEDQVQAIFEKNGMVLLRPKIKEMQ